MPHHVLVAGIELVDVVRVVRVDEVIVNLNGASPLLNAVVQKDSIKLHSMRGVHQLLAMRRADSCNMKTYLRPGRSRNKKSWDETCVNIP